MVRPSGRTLLPYHPKPKPDELFSSWLRRVAQGNSGSHRVHPFCDRFWPGRQLWTRDLDTVVREDVVRDLAELTATPWIIARETMLARFDGLVFEDVSRAMRKPWLCPVGVYHRTRRQAGLQWCPICLCEDERRPHYRRAWRFAFTTTCDRHGVVLTDRCHGCDAPAVPHRRVDEGCVVCGLDRRDAPFGRPDPRAVAVQEQMTIVLRAGRAQLPEGNHQHPLVFSRILHRIVSLLAFRPKSTALREVVARRFGGDPAPPAARTKALGIEGLPVVERHRLFALALPLLDDWPHRMIAVFQEAGLSWAWVLADNEPGALPYALFRPVRDHLFEQKAAWRPQDGWCRGLALTAYRASPPVRSG